ncbi:MAG: response regulator [Vulcanimicrobiaceae bacterium]
MGKRILIVDDEPQIGDALQAYLEREGFATVVCGSVAAATAEIERMLPDLLLLDLTLPDGSGFDILRAIQGSRLPTIVLSARAEEVDRVVGLELGADDYVTKPFSPREVVARIRAVMRRVEEATFEHSRDAGRLRIGDLEIDMAAHAVRISGREASLTPSEFKLLAILAEHPGQVFTRRQLLDRIDDDGTIYERTLDRHINNVRHKIEPNPRRPAYLLTVFGVGYKLMAP